MNNTKILIIAKSLDKRRGGIEAWSHSIYDYLVHHSRDCAVYAGDSFSLGKYFSLMIRSVFSGDLFLLTDWHRIKYLKILFILKLLRIKRNPFIILIHGDDILNFSRIRKLLFSVLGSLPTTRFACTSHAALNLLKPMLRDNTSASVCNPIFNFQNFVKPEPVQLPDYDILFFTVSRLVPRKNIVSVLHAFKKLLQMHPDIKFHYIIAGKGPEENNIYQTIVNLELSEAVSFLGTITEGEKEYLYDKASLYILPALEQEDSIEGFGMVYIEAAYHNTMSLSGNTGGVTESVIDSVTGYRTDGSVINIYRAMINSLQSNQVSPALRKHAEKFSIQNNRDLLNLIDSMIIKR
ncbi:MAG: glycosyltransferase family 4 protein [Spirochaetes bacterium]|jgi:glycosyltransferase involved in cell wall biosynthesis|nr:glycosyltransferase family 4 protein [Spirochaetota bacterium]